MILPHSQHNMPQIFKLCCSPRLAKLAILCLVIILICATSTANPSIPTNHSEVETVRIYDEFDSPPTVPIQVRHAVLRFKRSMLGGLSRMRKRCYPVECRRSIHVQMKRKCLRTHSHRCICCKY